MAARKEGSHSKRQLAVLAGVTSLICHPAVVAGRPSSFGRHPLYTPSLFTWITA